MPRKMPERNEPTERVPEGVSVTDYLIAAFNSRDAERMARALWIAALTMGWNEFTSRVGMARMFLVPDFMRGANIPYQTVVHMLRGLGIVLTPFVNLPRLVPGAMLGFVVTWSEQQQRYVATSERFPDLSHSNVDPVTALNGLLMLIRVKCSLSWVASTPIDSNPGSTAE